MFAMLHSKFYPWVENFNVFAIRQVDATLGMDWKFFDVCKLAYLQQQHVRHGQFLTVRAANCWGGGWGVGPTMTSVYIVSRHNDVGGANTMNDLCKVAKQSRWVQKEVVL